MIRPTKDKRSSHCCFNIANRGAIDARKKVAQALRSGFGISVVVRSTTVKPAKANEVAVVTKLHGEGHGNSTLVIETDIYQQFVGMDGKFFTFDDLRQRCLHPYFCIGQRCSDEKDDNKRHRAIGAIGFPNWNTTSRCVFI
jgi:hypothetical protein